MSTGGGSLGLMASNGTNSFISEGYAVEFDACPNSPDPSGNHNALVDTSVNAPYDHIVYYNTNIANEDNVNHDIEILQFGNTVTLKVDGTQHFSGGPSSFNKTYSAMGLAAATGSWTDNHWVQDFVLLAKYSDPEPTTSVGAEKSLPVPGTVFYIQNKTGKVGIGAYTLPNTDGTNGQVLTTDGSGNVSWKSPISCSKDNYVLKRGNPTTLACSQIYDDGTHVSIGTTTKLGKLGIWASGDYTQSESADHPLEFLDESHPPELVYLYMGADATHRVSYIQATHPLLLQPRGGNVGIGTTDHQAELDVAGVIKAKGLDTTVYTAGGPGAGSVSLSNSNSWGDFPDLSITFTLSEPTTVMAHYEIAMPGGNSHLVTRLVVDGTVVSRSITGNTAYWSEDSVWFGELSAGDHTIKVQYRTPQGGTNDPAGTDYQNRILQVVVFGS